MTKPTASAPSPSAPAQDAAAQDTTSRDTVELDTRAPAALRRLAVLHAALEFGLSSLALYQHAADLEAARLAVESSTQQRLTLEDVQHMLSVLPSAFALSWRRPRRAGGNGGEWTLTLRRSAEASMAEQIASFRHAVNTRTAALADELQLQDPQLKGDELTAAIERELQLEAVPLPPKPEEEERPVQRLAVKATTDEAKEESEAERKALAAPVPSDLQSLPSWLVERVRRREVQDGADTRTNERVKRQRVLTTLPQLSDQLQALSLASRKSVFPFVALARQLGPRAPVPGQLEAQLYLLEDLAPMWVSVVLHGGEQYVKLERGVKFNRVKAALRRAVADAVRDSA